VGDRRDCNFNWYFVVGTMTKSRLSRRRFHPKKSRFLLSGRMPSIKEVFSVEELV
jgi:hypothetical protein